jgi:aminoglycoside phosphotransferase (APT) family kinase protein
MTAPEGGPEIATDLDPVLVEWLGAVTGATRLTVARGIGGASRAGHAVDAHLADGTTSELWLRSDPGFGPQSQTLYSLRREAAVYRALGPTVMRVAALVAVHPELPAFLLQRARGESRFAQIAVPADQLSVARQFIEQLAALHHLDPSELDLPELGEIGSLRGHVLDEIAEWETQYRAAGGGVPVVTLALSWLREHLPSDDDWPVVLVQGDTGPGNFMFSGGELTAITDWELAHWGDLHDDLAWILVRDTLERFPDLPARIHDYEECSGRRVDPDRLNYFRVLAQLRATIGTLAGLRGRDGRAEIAWQLIYNTLHTRVLAESLAAASDVAIPEPLVIDDADARLSWVYDVALRDLRDVVGPALDDPFAATRVKGIARLVKYLRDSDRLAPGFEATERAELTELLAAPVEDIDAGRLALCDAIANGTIDAETALPYCLAQAARDTAVMRSAMGSLADRHITPVDTLQGGEVAP